MSYAPPGYVTGVPGAPPGHVSAAGAGRAGHGDIPRRRWRIDCNNSDTRETPRSRPRALWCPSRHPPILERSARFDNERCTR